MATLALFLALAGGTVYAAGKISGNTIKANSVTGKQVKEETLKGVNAGSAGSLMQVRKIGFGVGVDDAAPYAPVLSLGGLEITAACRSFGDLLDVKASTTKDGASLSLAAFSTNSADDTNGTVEAMDSSGPAVNVDNFFPNSGGQSMGTLHYVAPDGTVVVVHLALFELGFGCSINGMAFGA